MDRLRGGAERAIEGILWKYLEGADELLPFARAVIQHLSRAPGARLSAEQIADRVGASLHAIVAAQGLSTSSNLGNDPELVASFFQNADLLTPGRPLTKSVGSAVMRAVEEMHG